MLTTHKPKLLVLETLETKNEITKYYNLSGGMTLPSFTRGMALPSPLFIEKYKLPHDLFDFDDTFDEEQISAYLKRLAREWECMKRHNSTCLKNDELRRRFALQFQCDAEYMLKRAKSLIDEKNLSRAKHTIWMFEKNPDPICEEWGCTFWSKDQTFANCTARAENALKIVRGDKKRKKPPNEPTIYQSSDIASDTTPTFYHAPPGLFDFDVTFDEEQISARLERLLHERWRMEKHNRAAVENDAFRRRLAQHIECHALNTLKMSKSLIDESDPRRAFDILTTLQGNIGEIPEEWGTTFNFGDTYEPLHLTNHLRTYSYDFTWGDNTFHRAKVALERLAEIKKIVIEILTWDCEYDGITDFAGLSRNEKVLLNVLLE
jgi:hypothetical protein